MYAPLIYKGLTPGTLFRLKDHLEHDSTTAAAEVARGGENAVKRARLTLALETRATRVETRPYQHCQSRLAHIDDLAARTRSLPNISLF